MIVRLILVAGLLGSVASAQIADPAPLATVGGGVGIGNLGTGAEKFAVAATVLFHEERLAVGVHGTFAEALDIFRSPTRTDRVAALLVGRSHTDGRIQASALVGPSYTWRVLQGNLIEPDRYERVERQGPGLMGRVALALYPIDGVPLGAHVDMGANASTAGLTTSIVPGLVVRLQR